MKSPDDWSNIFFNLDGEEMTFPNLVEAVQKEARDEAVDDCTQFTGIDLKHLKYEQVKRMG
jgi:hypothetical protein